MRYLILLLLAVPSLAFSQTPVKFKIVHTNTGYCNYDVVIPPIDLNSVRYKSNIKYVINELASMRHNPNFTAYIYDNAQAAELNLKDLGRGQRVTRSEAELINYHIVAIYGSDIDGIVRINYFENIPEEDRSPKVAWRNAFNEKEFNEGYKPTIK